MRGRSPSKEEEIEECLRSYGLWRAEAGRQQLDIHASANADAACMARDLIEAEGCRASVRLTTHIAPFFRLVVEPPDVDWSDGLSSHDFRVASTQLARLARWRSLPPAPGPLRLSFGQARLGDEDARAYDAFAAVQLELKRRGYVTESGVNQLGEPFIVVHGREGELPDPRYAAWPE